ncbi:putative cellulose synthase A catalytic subunit 9 [UDP-forming] [Platanthera zijinensis]|uniref:Cellulose synthase n=2 Tax=Platanthera TaxID=59352 RepID=A0AAP0BXW6_9ASPA
MGAAGGLVAGSGTEFVVISSDDSGSRSAGVFGGGNCEICGEEIEMKELNGIKELFVACDECGFPVCRPCYEYERREGDGACPSCRTPYKRQKGSARVDGDEEEDEADDLDHEFGFSNANWILPGSKFNIQNKYHLQESYSNQGAFNSSLYHPTSENNTTFPRLTFTEVNRHDHDFPIVPPAAHSQDFADQASFQGSCTPLQRRTMSQCREITLYGYGSIAWENRVQNWKRTHLHVKDGAGDGAFPGDFMHSEAGDGSVEAIVMDEARQLLSRKLPIAAKKINPYRIIIVLRLITIGFFFHYRLLNPVTNANALWLTSVICEIWLTISWILDQFPKWYPIDRETFLDRLSLRYEKEEESQLADIDIFVNTLDPKKDNPLATVNAVLSILAVDYPADKVSCYVSDDVAAILNFEALSETSLFARKWVPFCKKFSIEPRAPEWYFAQKIDYLKGKVDPAFVRERRAMKRKYEEFKVRINGLISMSQKVPEEGWAMQHGAPWPGNDAQDHPGMVQVFMGHGDSFDTNGDNLPRLIYVSREKRPGFKHHKKAGAMNALIRVSGVLSNAPFILNMDCGHYINNSKALREAMCFMMDPTSGNKVCFVQFPYKIDEPDQHDKFSDRVVYFNINMKGLDGIQGPICLGTGCVFRRQALYGIEAPRKKHQKSTWNCWPKWSFLCSSARRKNKKKRTKMDNKKCLTNNREISLQIHSLESIQEEVEGEMSFLVPLERLENKFGISPAFIASTIEENGRISKEINFASALEEALHVISCGYEDRTAWGKEVGWIYGSTAEGVLTGFKMHCNGWRSVYCAPRRTAFKGSTPTALLDYLHLVLWRVLGSVEIFISRHCPIWYGYGGGMKSLQRLSYISLVMSPWIALPLIIYCILPAYCLLTDNFLIPKVTIYSSIIFMTLFVTIIATSSLETHWGRVALDDWWRNEQLWVISTASSHLFALFRGIIEVMLGIKAKSLQTCAGSDRDSREQYKSGWSILLIPPMTILILNIIGVVSGISNAINGNYDSWSPLFGKVLFAIWVIIHLYPCLGGMMGNQNRVPTIVVVWSILLSSVCSLLWVRLNPFLSKSDGPVLEICGLDCD